MEKNMAKLRTRKYIFKRNFNFLIVFSPSLFTVLLLNSIFDNCSMCDFQTKMTFKEYRLQRNNERHEKTDTINIFVINKTSFHESIIVAIKIRNNIPAISL
jgi:hypothetical protein